MDGMYMRACEHAGTLKLDTNRQLTRHRYEDWTCEELLT